MSEILNVIRDNGGAATILAAVISVIGIIVGAVLNNIFQKSRLKKEQKVRFQDMIGEKISNALLEVREIVGEASAIEIFDPSEYGGEKPEPASLMDGQPIIYQAILEDSEALNAYFEKIHEARRNYNKYLDREAAAYLYYAERYLMQLQTYFEQEGAFVAGPIAGLLISADIQAWQRKFDTVLIKKINRHKCKLQKHDGIRWNYTREKIFRRLWKKSVLNTLVSEPEKEQ